MRVCVTVVGLSETEGRVTCRFHGSSNCQCAAGVFPYNKRQILLVIYLTISQSLLLWPSGVSTHISRDLAVIWC